MNPRLLRPASITITTARTARIVARQRFLPSIQPVVVHQPRYFTRALKMPSAKEVEDPHVAQEEVEEWKKRAPYRIHESNETFNARYEASCHCGKVQYELSREEPLDSKLCHCTTCQTQHAAPFQWAAIFKKDDISFRNGHHNLEWYDPTSKSIEHKLPCKVRCKYCHSPIMDEGRNMILLFPSLIHFKNEQEKLNFKPRLHMFYGQRVMDIPDGLPKWTGLNEGEGSELVEDSPPDMVRDFERKRTEEQKSRSSFEKGTHKECN